jgi:hypothetical protein
VEDKSIFPLYIFLCFQLLSSIKEETNYSGINTVKAADGLHGNVHVQGSVESSDEIQRKVLETIFSLFSLEDNNISFLFLNMDCLCSLNLSQLRIPVFEKHALRIQIFASRPHIKV